MAMKLAIFLGLLSALLCGCQSVVVREAPQPVRVADGVTIDSAPLVEALLARTGTVVQAVNGSWKENAFAAEVVMKGDGRQLTAIFLAPQMRLATITLTRPRVRASSARSEGEMSTRKRPVMRAAPTKSL